MNTHQWYMMGLRSVQPANTFIGGVASTISTPALLATKLGILESRITNFSVVGSDIQCNIAGTYDIPADAFSGYSITSYITYYNDIDNLVRIIGRDAFAFNHQFLSFKMDGVTTLFDYESFLQTRCKIYNFPNLTAINNYYNFNGCSDSEVIYIPLCTKIGASHSVNNDNFLLIKTGTKIYAHPSMATINGGGVEADLAAAIAAGNIVRYVSNFTAPNPITDLSTGTIYTTAIQLNFTPPSSTNTIDYYECYANGVLKNKITASGQYVSGLIASTSYTFTLISVDIFYNKSVVSNTITQSTSNGVITDLSAGTIYNTAIQLNFNTGVYQGTGYKVYLSGVYYQTITASGLYITGLTASTSYDITVRGVDAIYGEAAVSNTITQSTNTTPFMGRNNLISYYKLDSNSNDSYGSNNGTNTSVSYVTGKVGNAGSYNGTTSKTIIGNPVNLQLSTGTISCWIKTSGAGSSFRSVFGKTEAFNMFLVDGVFGIYSWAGSSGFKTTGVNLNDGIWHHIAFVFQSGTGLNFLYIDGILKLTTSMTILNQTNNVCIGSSNSTQYFNGLIDEASIYNRKLTQLEIDELYNSGNGITL